MNLIVSKNWFLVLLLLALIFGAESLIQPSRKILGKSSTDIQEPCLEEENCPTSEEINWYQVVEKHPDYLPAYIELAKRYWRLGDNQKAHEYWVKAKEINPNHTQVKLLEKLIG